MRAFKNLKIGAKLGVAFVVVVVDIAVVAFVGFAGMQAINMNHTATYNDRTRAIESVARANAAIYKLSGSLDGYVLLPDQREEAQRDIDAAIAEVNQEMALYKTTYLVQEERDELARFEPAWASYQQVIGEMRTKVRAGDGGAAHALLHGAALQAGSRGTVTALDQLIEINDRVAKELMAQSEKTFANATRDMLVAGAVGIILAVVLCAVLTHALVWPLRKAAYAAARMAEGDLEQHLEVQSGDEVGEMTAAFVQMIAYIHEMAGVAESIAMGNLRVTVTPRSDRDVLGNAFARMTRYLTEMAQAASCIAQGDLSQPIAPRAKDDVLGNAFAQMLSYLRHMANVAELIAHGNLAVNITPQSGDDVLGFAFIGMMGYLQEMAISAQRIARGDLSTQITVRSRSDVLGTSFLNMSTYLNRMASVAQQIAQGNLNVRFQPKSQDDALGQAFVSMTDYLRRMATIADRLARGDLAVGLVPVSKDDILGDALGRVLANLQRRADQI